MKPRGVLQPTNLGTKNPQQQQPGTSKSSSTHGSGDLDNELVAAMQQWDEEGDQLCGRMMLGEDGEDYGDCVMEGGATPPDLNDNQG